LFIVQAVWIVLLEIEILFARSCIYREFGLLGMGSFTGKSLLGDWL
jgi:hypothetical protein